MKKITLVTGGARSGKSSFALSLAKLSDQNVFIATAEAIDDEMRRRIDQHRKERGESFRTIEAPIHLAEAIEAVDEKTPLMIIDCLTVWLGNLQVKDETGHLLVAEVEALLNVLKKPPCRMILVTNEVGMGIVPMNEMSRDFRDHAGRLNQRVADIADDVVLMVSGIPVTIKSEL